MLSGVLGVDFRNDQRHIGVHAERAGVVHKHGPRLDDGRRKPLGDVVLRRAQHDVHALEGLIAGQLHGDVLSLPGQQLPHGPFRRQQVQLRHREIPLRQDLHHLTAHRTGGAQDRNFILFHG